MYAVAMVHVQMMVHANVILVIVVVHAWKNIAQQIVMVMVYSLPYPTL
jgi:hypothetical protein